MKSMRLFVVACVLVMLSVSEEGRTTSTHRWIVDTTQELLAGHGDNVAVTAEGRLRSITGWSSGPSFEEPVVMAGAAASDGSIYVGTSHPARLYRVKGSSAELLAEIPAEQITALLVTPSGGVVIATVAPGVVYRWDGRLEEAGTVADGGLWDLAYFDGAVIAAGGPPATLYRLGDRGLERWVELPDVHASCLAATDDRLLVGTSDKGLILGVDRKGTVGVLADSPFTEISSIVVGGGAVWATALVGEPVSQTKAIKSNGNGDEESAETEISVGSEMKLPKVNGKTATSEVIKLTPDGGILSIHRFLEEVASAAAWDGEGLLVGTGYEGEVWRFVGDGGSRIATIDAVQVVGVIGAGRALLTQGPGGILWRDVDDRAGRYRSAAEQFKQPVHFGEFRVDPPTAAARIRFRSGVSADPDDTWLEWTDWAPATTGVVDLPSARALQWEIELPAGGDADLAIDRVEVAVVDINMPPSIESFEVEDPGVVYLSGPPPSGPVIESVHPNFNGIFTVIEEGAPPKNGGSAKGKKYYRTGFRTVRWKAVDANQDPMRFSLEIEDRGEHRIPVRDRITGSQIGIDTSALPDGTYRFLLTASDEARNPAGALEAQRASRWFAIDNTAPEVTLQRSGGKWLIAVKDAMSPIIRAEWSRDGEAWQGLAPMDGVLDGREENFEFPAADGDHVVVVRVVDRQHNRSTAGAVEK